LKEIVIYKSDTNQIEVDVQFENETLWLNRNQLATLFDRDIKTIGKHINNIFREGELQKNSVVANFAITALDNKTYQTEHFNLDVIISVGYRVKSKQGTQFRIWANNVLKEYLVSGYIFNEKRLAQKEQEIRILKNGIHILNRAIDQKSGDNEWLSIFSKGLSLLDDYDHEELDIKGTTTKTAEYPSLEEYQVLID